MLLKKNKPKSLEHINKLCIFAADMADKYLYIISGPNGAGKTTASYSVLPKILHCKELFKNIEGYVKRRA